MFSTIISIVLAVLKAAGAWLEGRNDQRLIDAGRDAAERDALLKEKDNAAIRDAVDKDVRRIDAAAVGDRLRPWTRG